MGSNNSIVPILFLVLHRGPDRRRFWRLVGVNCFSPSPPFGDKSHKTPTAPFPRFGFSFHQDEISFSQIS